MICQRKLSRAVSPSNTILSPPFKEPSVSVFSTRLKWNINPRRTTENQPRRMVAHERISNLMNGTAERRSDHRNKAIIILKNWQ